MASAKRAWKVGTSCLNPGVSTFARLLAMTSSRWACAAAPSAEMYIPYGMGDEQIAGGPPASAALLATPMPKQMLSTRAMQEPLQIQMDFADTTRSSRSSASILLAMHSANFAGQQSSDRQLQRVINRKIR